MFIYEQLTTFTRKRRVFSKLKLFFSIRCIRLSMVIINFTDNVDSYPFNTHRIFSVLHYFDVIEPIAHSFNHQKNG